MFLASQGHTTLRSGIKLSLLNNDVKQDHKKNRLLAVFCCNVFLYHTPPMTTHIPSENPYQAPETPEKVQMSEAQKTRIFIGIAVTSAAIAWVLSR